MNASTLGLVRMFAVGVLATSAVACTGASPDVESDTESAENPLEERGALTPTVLDCAVLVNAHGAFTSRPLWRIVGEYDANGNARIDFTHPVTRGVGGPVIGNIRGTITSHLTGTSMHDRPANDFAVKAELTLATGEVLHGGITMPNTAQTGAFLRQENGALVGTDDARHPPVLPGAILIYLPCFAKAR